jgi:hypothetical protein
MPSSVTEGRQKQINKGRKNESKGRKLYIYVQTETARKYYHIHSRVTTILSFIVQ